MNILPRLFGVTRQFRPGRLQHVHRLFSNSSRSLSSNQNSDLEVGSKIHGYTVEKVVPVPEFYLTAIYLSHDKTGAQHLHIDRQDSDNVFGVAFRTTPLDSTGVPHILEHTALCGSEKYPVRDPFFKMLNRSLSTFMNAFTASDWTMYPFSTQNHQDYMNLMSVYLDAAFVPKLTELDFRQEGWRLEHADVNDKSSPIIFKGVVYNEMKGVFSNSQQVFDMRNQSLLLPSHTYGVVSGGDPAHIPQLSWQQLRDFHKSHYHPSNSRFYTYGDFPLAEHLQFINDNTLNRFDKIFPDTEVKNETRWTSPRESAITCASDPMAPDPNKQTTVAVSYLLEPTTSIYESHVLSFLSNLLVHGDKAPFYRSLIEANIGSDYSPVLGYDGYTKEASFSVGLQGIHDNDVDRVKEIIEKTFDEVIEQGFEQDRIDALLHKIELGQKHQSSRFGLNLGVQLIGSWIHDADPTENIQVTKYVDMFKKNMADDPEYLRKMVKKYFKDNRHKLTLVMRPDKQFETKRQEMEKVTLEETIEKLTDGQKDRLFNQGLELIDVQNTEEDLSCLPTLKVMDIPSSITPVDTETIEAHNIPIQLTVQPTNGVVYFRAVSNIAGLREDLKPYVPLFTSVVTKMGAGMMDFRELSQQMDLYTGGMSASPHLADHYSDSDLYEQGVLLSSYCLDRNFEKMMNLWFEIFNGYPVHLDDTDRLKTLIMMSAAELSSSVVDAGHSYAMTHSANALSASCRLREEMSGMAQVSLMKNVAEMADLTPIVQKMKEIGRQILVRDNLRCSVNATPKYIEKATTTTERFIERLEAGSAPLKSKYTKSAEQYPLETLNTHFELPFQVHYMSRSVRTVPYTYMDFANLRILGRLMTNKFLHREIREKGGAYGGGARSTEPGSFSFYSYRDPNSMKTLEAFENAVSWATSGDFTQQDLDEAKLAVFAQVDAPVPPGSRGLQLFLYGIDDDMRQGHRRQLFTVSKENIVQAADKYLSPANRVSSTTFLGPENNETKDSKSWKVIRHS